MKIKVRECLLNLLIFTIYLTFTFIVMINHEAWSDEAQAWLLVRDLDFFSLLKQLAIEGHPSLWYLILFPFVKLGFPYITLNVVSWIISCITVALILKFAPFNKLIKIAFITCSSMIYYYPVVSRSYVLIPLFIVLICIFWNERHRHPIIIGIFIALLGNIHLLTLPISGILILTFYIYELFIKRVLENKKNIIIGFLIASLGVIIAIIQISGAVFSNNLVNNIKVINVSLVKLIETIIYGANIIRYTKDIYIMKVDILTYLIIIAIVLIAILMYKKSKTSFLLYITVTVSILVVHTLFWIENTQRVTIIFMPFLFFLWNYKYKEKNKYNISDKVIISCILFLLFISGYNGIYNGIKDISGVYSYGKKTSEFITNTIPINSIFICDTEERTSSIIPYLGKNDYKFFCGYTNEYFTFANWDKQWTIEFRINELVSSIRQFNNQKNVYVILSKINKRENNAIIQKMISDGEITLIYNGEENSICQENGNLDKYNIYTVNVKK